MFSAGNEALFVWAFSSLQSLALIFGLSLAPLLLLLLRAFFQQLRARLFSVVLLQPPKDDYLFLKFLILLLPYLFTTLKSLGAPKSAAFSIPVSLAASVLLSISSSAHPDSREPHFPCSSQLSYIINRSSRLLPIKAHQRASSSSSYSNSSLSSVPTFFNLHLDTCLFLAAEKMNLVPPIPSHSDWRGIE